MKWCGDDLDPTRPSKSPGSFSRRFAPQGVDFRELRARCRKAALNEQGTRGARRKALNRSQLECLSLGEWSRTSLSRRLPRQASLRGVSVPEVRFESLARCPSCLSRRAAPVTSVGSRAHMPRDFPGRSEVTPVNNEGVSPLSCARTHGGGEETTTLR